ncbi:protein of unknown function (DUF397) [Streptomyces sp. SceaMP-e96]|uniref:DUF397 domain-containing protein n=1 Tax=Streptomyces TaxID=1883 RepID=UPI000823DE9A|nr:MULTISPECIES: DUF397 domain-containing protein [unclassified Streptomyces]MYT13114.1 DUF397 domain-containing protein [Streptomyces sp. SID4951]SCK44996.1 protein of unknown function (DUF397) [Streptomyces sp. SceaMP-e96]
MTDYSYRKSSYSDHKEECVEVATNVPGSVSIRDSKNPAGPILQLAPDTWTAFRSAVAAGRFER